MYGPRPIQSGIQIDRMNACKFLKLSDPVKICFWINKPIIGAAAYVVVCCCNMEGHHCKMYILNMSLTHPLIVIIHCILTLSPQLNKHATKDPIFCC